MGSYLVSLWNRETKFLHSTHLVNVSNPADAVAAGKAACLELVNPNHAPGYDNYPDAFHASVVDAVTGNAVDVVDETRSTNDELAALRARVDAFEKAETERIEADFRHDFGPVPPPPPVDLPNVDSEGTAS